MSHKISVTLYGATVADLIAAALNFANDAGGSDDEAPTNSAATSSAAPLFDSAGTPWDARIHSAGKQTVADGTWRKRKNLPEGEFDRVMAEIKAKAATPGTIPNAPPAVAAGVAAVTASHPDATQPVMPAAPAYVPPPSVVIAPAVPAAPVAPPPPTMPAAPVPAAPVAPPPAASVEQPGMPFATFMPRIAAALQANKFSSADLSGYLSQWQIAEIGQLAADPVKTLQFFEWLKSAGLVE